MFFRGCRPTHLHIDPRDVFLLEMLLSNEAIQLGTMEEAPSRSTFVEICLNRLETVCHPGEESPIQRDLAGMRAFLEEQADSMIAYAGSSSPEDRVRAFLEDLYTDQAREFGILVTPIPQPECSNREDRDKT